MHKHHIIPKHAGGSDNPGNITPPIPVVRHSMFHWCEWHRTGNELDRIAWKTLSGLIGHEEARILACKEQIKRAIINGTHHLLPQNRTWDQSLSSKKSAQTSLERGTLNLLKFNTSGEHSIRVSKHQKKLVEDGTHHFLRGNETWDRSTVARENARKQILNGTLPLLSHNRKWDYSAIAKEARERMDDRFVTALVRKQTVNRRINSGWTEEKIKFIKEQLPCSSGKLFKLCKQNFEWPFSRGVIQNILKVLKNEDLKDIFNLDYRIES